MSGFNLSMEKFDTFFQEQHPETVIEGWLDLPESEPFRLTEPAFGQSNFTESETGGYSTNCILSWSATTGVELQELDQDDEEGASTQLHKQGLFCGEQGGEKDWVKLHIPSVWIHLHIAGCCERCDEEEEEEDDDTGEAGGGSPLLLSHHSYNPFRYKNR